MKSYLFMLVAVGVAVGLSGCSSAEPLGTIHGIITSGGEPVTEATISFRNVESGESVSAELDANGEFQITGAGGVTPGEYKVILLPPEVEVSLGPDSPPTTKLKEMPNLPKRYRNIQTTPLTAVVAKGANTVNFELTEK